jgi:hypothetical protein
VSSLQAKKIIEQNVNAKEGSFIVRISPKNLGSFWITVVGRKKTLLHYRVVYDRNSETYVLGKQVFQTMDGVIQGCNRELYLRYVCPGSKFQNIETAVNSDPLLQEL